VKQIWFVFHGGIGEGMESSWHGRREDAEKLWRRRADDVERSWRVSREVVQKARRRETPRDNAKLFTPLNLNHTLLGRVRTLVLSAFGTHTESKKN